MPTAAVGSISLVKDTAITTLANVTAFQSLVRAENATEAKTHIYRVGPPLPASGRGTRYTKEELEGLRSFGILFDDPESPVESVQSAMNSDGTLSHAVEGALLVSLFMCVAPEVVENHEEVDMLLQNSVGEITDEFNSLAGRYPYLTLVEPATKVGDVRKSIPTDLPGQGAFFTAQIRLAYGDIR